MSDIVENLFYRPIKEGEESNFITYITDALTNVEKMISETTNINDSINAFRGMKDVDVKSLIKDYEKTSKPKYKSLRNEFENSINKLTGVIIDDIESSM